nr:putative reverse transcriptase domain-containing protein [Tanacetum cinerariifolium]
DTWIDPAETVPEIEPVTVEEVNNKVIELAELHEHDVQDLYALLEDAQDSRTRKLVQIPYGNETLTFRGNESNNIRESQLTIISCLKAQEYMEKGCQIFLAQISAKKEEEKLEGKQLEDVPVVQDYPEVFPEDLPGLPPARQWNSRST